MRLHSLYKQTRTRLYSTIVSSIKKDIVSGSTAMYFIPRRYSWDSVAKLGERTDPGGTFRGAFFDGVVACYIYPSLRIATSYLYLLIN